jgi:hypothetical protein
MKVELQCGIWLNIQLIELFLHRFQPAYMKDLVLDDLVDNASSGRINLGETYDELTGNDFAHLVPLRA